MSAARGLELKTPTNFLHGGSAPFPRGLAARAAPTPPRTSPAPRQHQPLVFGRQGVRLCRRVPPSAASDAASEWVYVTLPPVVGKAPGEEHDDPSQPHLPRGQGQLFHYTCASAETSIISESFTTRVSGNGEHSTRWPSGCPAGLVLAGRGPALDGGKPTCEGTCGRSQRTQPPCFNISLHGENIFVFPWAFPVLCIFTNLLPLQRLRLQAASRSPLPLEWFVAGTQGRLCQWEPGASLKRVLTAEEAPGSRKKSRICVAPRAQPKLVAPGHGAAGSPRAALPAGWALAGCTARDPRSEAA